jgi:hypothetical protein
VNAIHAGHARCRDLSTKCQYLACVCAELHMIAVDPALQFAMLIRSMEGSRNNVAVLTELDLFQRTSRLACVVGVDGRVARMLGSAGGGALWLVEAEFAKGSDCGFPLATLAYSVSLLGASLSSRSLWMMNASSESRLSLSA